MKVVAVFVNFLVYLPKINIFYILYGYCIFGQVARGFIHTTTIMIFSKLSMVSFPGLRTCYNFYYPLNLFLNQILSVHGIVIMDIK